MGVLSKIKLFSFSEKVRKRSPMGFDFGTIVEPKLTTIDEKRGSKTCFKKGYPPRRKHHSIHRYSQAGRLLETGLACAFSRTETTVRTTTAATTATIAERNDCTISATATTTETVATVVALC